MAVRHTAVQSGLVYMHGLQLYSQAYSCTVRHTASRASYTHDTTRALHSYTHDTTRALHSYTHDTTCTLHSYTHDTARALHSSTHDTNPGPALLQGIQLYSQAYGCTVRHTASQACSCTVRHTAVQSGIQLYSQAYSCTVRPCRQSYTHGATCTPPTYGST